MPVEPTHRPWPAWLTVAAAVLALSWVALSYHDSTLAMRGGGILLAGWGLVGLVRRRIALQGRGDRAPVTAYTGAPAVLLGLFMLSVGLSVVMFSLVDVIPPASLTITRLEVLGRAGEKWRGNSRACPRSVAQLSEASPKHPKRVDGWRRPIILKCEPNGPATLESLGADGKPGGTGDDQDLSVSF